MKKLILTTLAVFVIAVFSHGQTLDEVLAKHFKAVGQEKLASINTFSIKATVNQMGIDLPMEMKMKKPGKFRLDMDMQGQKMIQAFDGENGWMIAPWVSMEPQDLEGDQLKQAISQANMEGELYNYAAKGHMADLIGKVKDGDKNVFQIKLTTEDGNIRDYFIDAELYLVTKVKAKISAMGQIVEVEQRMMDYKEIEGIKMAMKIESDSPMGTAMVIMEEIKFNEEIDDSIFKRPSK